jgi:hypothetical protein
MRMLLRKIVVSLVILLALLFSSCGPQPPRKIVFPRTLPTPYPKRQLISSDFSWQELWRQQQRGIYGDVPLAVVVKDRIILPIDAASPGMLVALNIHTGQPIWIQEFFSPYRGDG